AAKQRGVRKIPHVELAIGHDEARQLADELEAKHEQRARVLRAVLEWGGAIPTFQLERQTGTSDSPWKTLVKHGALRRVSIDEHPEPLVPDTSEVQRLHVLNDDQQQAVDAIGHRLDAREHR